MACAHPYISVLCFHVYVHFALFLSLVGERLMPQRRVSWIPCVLLSGLTMKVFFLQPAFAEHLFLK